VGNEKVASGASDGKLKDRNGGAALAARIKVVPTFRNPLSGAQASAR
jgi:hypothetical protein